MSPEQRKPSVRGVLLHVAHGSTLPHHQRTAIEWLSKRYSMRYGRDAPTHVPEPIWRGMYKRHPEALRGSWSPVLRNLAARCDSEAAMASIYKILNQK